MYFRSFFLEICQTIYFWKQNVIVKQKNHVCNLKNVFVVAKLDFLNGGH